MSASVDENQVSSRKTQSVKSNHSSRTATLSSFILPNSYLLFIHISGNEDEFTKLCSVLHQFVRLTRLFQRQDTINDGANLSALYELHSL